MQPDDILSRVRPILHDLEGVRWPDSEILLYIADAQQQVVEVRPSANAFTRQVSLKKGQAAQNPPADSRQILQVTHNLGTSGDRPGGAIVMTSLATLNAMNPEWQRETGTEVELWAYEPDEDADLFWVYPVPSQVIYVEMTYSRSPAAEVELGEDMELSRQYISAITNWVLYRCFSKDADYGSAPARAQQHLEAFATAMGVKLRTLGRTDPNMSRRGGQTDGQV